MMKYFLLLYLAATTSAFTQVSGNVEFEKSNDNYSYSSRSSSSASYDKMYLSDTTILIPASVIMNVKADEFVAVWAVKEESKTISQCITKIDNRISSFILGMKKSGVTEPDIDVDFISEHPIYDYALSGNVAEERLEGFEVQKNVSVRFKNRKLFDSLVVTASQNEIYDLVKVDYYVKNSVELRDQLFEEAVKIINRKKDKYTQKLNVKVKPNAQVYAEDYEIFFPSERYHSYPAFESANLKQTNSWGSKNETWIKEKRKSKTFFYNGLTLEGFDAVINPLIIEPVVQFTIRLSMRYEMAR
jgi:uncharacterized protein YggE